MNPMRQPRTALGLLTVTLLLLTACGGGANEETGEATAQGSGTAPGELPPGHPSLDEGAQAGTIAPPPPGSGSGAAGLAWSVPATWTEEPPANAMRKAQYRVGNDASCVVYYFGPGEGGDAKSNAERWADQFEQPDGRASREVMTTEQMEIDGMPVTWVEVAGSYTEGMMGGPARTHAGYMLLGAIAEGPDANWFFKFTGPEGTVSQERAAFRAMVESLQRGS